VFLVENSTAIAKKIYLYEYNKSIATYNWKGFFTANIGATATNVCRGFRALRYLHTTGTVSVAAPALVFATGISFSFLKEYFKIVILLLIFFT
jgi:hypothetical protein